MAGQIHLSYKIDAIAARVVAPSAPATATASGNLVVIHEGRSLPDAPRTVEQVADFLGVTPDTVREAYIPAWIAAGHMSDSDRRGNQWAIPPGLEPYRP